jgi:hypothetical protein
MRALKILGAACVVAAAAMPAFADDMMAPTMSMMKAGEVMSFMPDGNMGTMTVDAAAAAKVTGMAKPIDHCVMLMMGADGKTYMVDTSSADAMKECEATAK